MNKHLLATALSAVLLSTCLMPSPTQASTSPTTAAAAVAPHGKPCNAHGYKTKARHVHGHVFGKATRLATKTYSGPTTIQRGTRIHSRRNLSIDANVTAKGGLEIGAGAILEKFVKVLSNLHTDVSWYLHPTANTNESKTITTHDRQRVTHATSVVFFSGWFGARGTGEYSYCDAIEGSGEGYVKWQKTRWHTYGGHGSGAQDCRERAHDLVAQDAKDAVCI